MAEPKEPLTERELEVVRLLGTGAGNKDIAAQLFLSPNTVKVHLRNIFTKLEATSRTEVTMIAIHNGWISVDQPILASQDISSTAPAPEQDQAAVSVAIQPEVVVTDAVNTSAHPLSGSPENIPPEAIPLPPVISVPVAPNPQAIPSMATWRRIVLLLSFPILMLIIALAIPPNTISSADLFDPLRIGPSQPRNGLLSKGESSRWYLRAPLPAARARGVAIAAGNRIFVIGGEINQTVSADVMVYEPVSNTWTLLNTPKPTAVANTAATLVGSRIYFAGGTTAEGTPSSVFEAYDTVSGQWQVLAALPVRLAGHAIAGLQNQIFVFGGAGDSGTTSDSYRYDITANTWLKIKPMLTPRSLMSADTVNDRIYVIGGFNEGRELTTCEYYVPANDAWSSCASMTVPRSGLGLARVGTSLFAIGGGSTGFIGFNERYDTLSDRWTPLETPITSDWQSVAVASMPGEFFVFGGYSNGDRLSFAYVYEVFTNRAYVPAFIASDSSDKKP